MNLTLMITVILVFYMIYMNLTLGKKAKKSKQLNEALQNFYDKEKLFPELESFIENEQEPLYISKYRIIQAWAAAYYNEEELFRNALSHVDIDVLMTNGKKSTVLEQEDSFYYLFLGIPNRLFYNGREDLTEVLFSKLDAYDDQLDTYLFHRISKAMRKFYAKEDDRGRQVYVNINDGDYEGYAYSKNLIGIYKNICSVFLAAIAQDENDEELFEQQRPYLDAFVKSNLGQRWVSELHLEIEEETEEEPEETEEEEEPEEAETEETEEKE